MAPDIAKKAAAKQAAALIESNKIIGLGTGSTAVFFIQELAKRVKEGLFVKGIVSSSKHSTDLAQKLGLKVENINDLFSIDLTVDGADEVDPEKRLIKGRGGAHVREKILASSSKEMVVIVDHSKLVEKLGKGVLPVEIVYYGSPATRQKIEMLGYRGNWRLDSQGSLFLTENGNTIFDIFFSSPPLSPEHVHQELLSLPGVVDTGFFFHLAKRIIIGYENGTTEIRQ